MLDLAQRNGQQVADQVAAHEEEGLGGGVVGVGADGAVVLDEHAPGDQLASAATNARRSDVESSPT